MREKIVAAISLEKAIELRQKYPMTEEYISLCKSDKAYVFDSWMGTDKKLVINVNPKPARPANYKMLDIHWDFLDVDRAFNGYPAQKIIDLIEKEELFYAPVL